MRRARLALLAVVPVIAAGALLLAATSQPKQHSFASLDREIGSSPPLLIWATWERIHTPLVVLKSKLAADIDRRAYLRHHVGQIVATAKTDQKRVERWTAWVQNHIAHVFTPPLDTDGQAVYDPIWLLKNRAGLCGQTNRLLADGLSAIGYPTRLVQFFSHVGTEVFFDGGWRYIDADAIDFGQIVKKKDGSIPSAIEIAADLSLLDTIEPFGERLLYPGGERFVLPASVEGRRAKLKNNFTRKEEHPGGMVTPYLWIKTATPQQEQNHYYGWNYYRAAELAAAK